MPKPLHVSLIAIPDASISTLHGLYDVLNSFRMLKGADSSLPETPPFTVEIVAQTTEPIRLASGLPVQPHRGIAGIHATDIVIVPSVVLNPDWRVGRYPGLVDWLQQVHERGATLCSACSGAFLIAETGLLDGRSTTLHWSYAPDFHKLYPNVPICPEKTLVVAGERGQFVSSGASMSWHDLALYLVARHVGPTTAQTVARFFALQWHRDGLGPYMLFEGRRDHGDAAILEAQDWLAKHFSVADPVDEMIRRSGLAERTFNRRFSNATSHAPLAYVQQLRIEDAKRRLERTNDSVEEIGWRVGYEDPAFFRRLFKRLTGVTPGHYRRQFQIPDFATSDTRPDRT
ncbi:GlxA family transcriptional regulator [Ferrovibrio sp.]|jgi:transcriptional regulator GlxA family with amidase domain|uniref:GlxA family transcriptional regulator n=1 Tax=Ferrovibrio sp. TaxID=1917215 RepID=UPI0035AF9729